MTPATSLDSPVCAPGLLASPHVPGPCFFRLTEPARDIELHERRPPGRYDPCRMVKDPKSDVISSAPRAM
jgi:hypothetical protein